MALLFLKGGIKNVILACVQKQVLDAVECYEVFENKRSNIQKRN